MKVVWEWRCVTIIQFNRSPYFEWPHRLDSYQIVFPTEHWFLNSLSLLWDKNSVSDILSPSQGQFNNDTQEIGQLLYPTSLMFESIRGGLRVGGRVA